MIRIRINKIKNMSDLQHRIEMALNEWIVDIPEPLPDTNIIFITHFPSQTISYKSSKTQDASPSKTWIVSNIDTRKIPSRIVFGFEHPWN